MNTKIRAGLLLSICAAFISCTTYRTDLQVESINVSFSGGNTYKSKQNNGGLKLAIHSKETPETSPRINTHFDVYSSGETPVTLSIKRNNNLAVLSNEQGEEFVLGELKVTDSSCYYDCSVIFAPSDKITFKSELSAFRHWNGIHILNKTPLFIRYHYYTLKITKKDGEVLIAKWKYGIYRVRNSNSSKHWTGDQALSNSGLVTLKIKK